MARSAGVSRATVSHVLNGQIDKFAPDTVDRVRRAAADLGYVPSAAGRALAVGRSDFVVIAVSRFVSMDMTLEAVSAHLAELGFMSVVHFRLSETERLASARLHHLVATLRPAGAVDLGGMSRRDVELLEESGCPVVPSPAWPEANGNHLIARLQAEHLVARGYDRIVCAFPAGVGKDAYSEARAEGVEAVCARAGLPGAEVVEIPAQPGAVRDLVRRLTTEPGRTGVAAYDDTVARTLVDAAAACGVAVPGRLGVIGVRAHDDAPPAVPLLSSVEFDVAALLEYIRWSVARAYGPERFTEVRLPDDGFQVVPGRST